LYLVTDDTTLEMKVKYIHDKREDTWASTKLQILLGFYLVKSWTVFYQFYFLY